MATIVCVVGDKGGTGKSTWARGLADLYRLTRRPAALFDGDWLARSLFKFYRSGDEQGRPLSLDRQDPRRGCILYDARDRRYGRDLLLNSMAFPGVDVILHDLPAGFRTDISWLMSVSNPTEALKDFAASAEMLGHRMVLVNVFTPSPSDFHTAPWLAETVGRSATVIGVRNGLFDPPSYAVWQRDAAKGFAAAGGIEIEVPRLNPIISVMCDQRTLRFTDAINDERLTLADRLRLVAWLRRFAESLAPVAEVLRLPADIVERVAALRVENPSAVPAVEESAETDEPAEPAIVQAAAAPPAAAPVEAPVEAPVARPDPVPAVSRQTKAPPVERLALQAAADADPTTEPAPPAHGAQATVAEAAEPDGAVVEKPELRPTATRSRSPSGRRPLSEFIARAGRAASSIAGTAPANGGSQSNGGQSNGSEANGGPGGKQAAQTPEERFLLASDKPIM